MGTVKRNAAPECTGNIAAVILAAGLSERMGRFKPMLPLGATSPLQRCLNLFTSAGIDELLVVTGHNRAEMESDIIACRAVQIVNPHYKEGMFSSIVAGIRALADACDAFFILPVDIPLVRRATVRQLLDSFARFRPLICYPVFDRQRGHPPLISASLIEDILKWDGSGGLAGFLRRMEPRAMDVPVADQAVLLDMDTPSDYQYLQELAERCGIPVEKECRALLQEVYPATQKVQAHCRMVARVARGLGEALVNSGVPLDIELLTAAAAVHDLARGRRRHGQAGARLLNHWGFSAVAPLVEVHMDLEVAPLDPVDEAQVLYLADKLVREDRLADLDRRFQMKLDQYGEDPSAAFHIRARWQAADTIRKKVESETGLPLDKILVGLF